MKSSLMAVAALLLVPCNNETTIADFNVGAASLNQGRNAGAAQDESEN